MIRYDTEKAKPKVSRSAKTGQPGLTSPARSRRRVFGGRGGEGCGLGRSMPWRASCWPWRDHFQWRPRCLSFFGVNSAAVDATPGSLLAQTWPHLLPGRQRRQAPGGGSREAGGGLALPQGGRVRERSEDRGAARPRELEAVAQLKRWCFARPFPKWNLRCWFDAKEGGSKQLHALAWISAAW